MRDAICRIEFTRRAERDLVALPPFVRGRLRPRIDALGRKPRPPGAKKLAGGEDIYRLRVGDYRVLYQIQDDDVLVLVVRVGHRRMIYRQPREKPLPVRVAEPPAPAP